MSDLPKGWGELKVVDTYTSISSSKIKVKTSESNESGKFPVVDQGQKFISGYIDDADRTINLDSPLIVFGDHTREIKYIDFQFAPGADGTQILRPHDFYDPKLYYYFLCTLDLENRGYGRHFKLLKESDLRLPPLNEQKRIADKLDQILEEVDSAKARLDQIPTILKNFRQSIYNAVATGALSRGFREGNISTPDALRDFVLKSNQNEKNYKKIFSEPETVSNIEIPDSWTLLNLDKLCLKFTYGSSQKSQKEGDVPVLRMGNLQGGQLDWADLVYSSDQKEIDKYQLMSGDLLFNRTNSPELVGKTAIYRGEQESIYAGYLIKISPPDYLSSEFLNMYMNSSYAKHYCWQVKTDGVSQSNINAKKLGKMPIPFCSLEEQEFAVKRALELLQMSNQIEEKYYLAMEQVDKITQSVLAKAFRGELVPQDPNDEPASVLLERIKEQKALAESQPKSKKRKKKIKSKSQEHSLSDYMKIFDKIEAENLKEKYTDSKLLKAFLNTPEISSEDLFKQCCSDETEISEFYIELNSLISDGLVIEEKDQETKTIILKAA